MKIKDSLLFKCFSVILLLTLPLHMEARLSSEGGNKVCGVVSDADDNTPLAGVTVYISGTTKGTSTDGEGFYELSVPGTGCTVVFSCMGYEELAIKYTGDNKDKFRSIKLAQESAKLDEVVVTGVYERKKDSFTGSVTSFGGNELSSVGSQNMLQSLKTLDPSFKIMESTQFGSNPNKMPDIEIRGKSSVMGLKEEYGTDPNQPLFILDGFETDIETVMNLNMNRVKFRDCAQRCRFYSHLRFQSVKRCCSNRD